MELIYKGNRSLDYSLKLENMKEESLVIANQHVAVNCVTDLVHTARHATGVGLVEVHVFLVEYSIFYVKIFAISANVLRIVY